MKKQLTRGEYNGTPTEVSTTSPSGLLEQYALRVALEQEANAFEYMASTDNLHWALNISEAGRARVGNDEVGNAIVHGFVMAFASNVTERQRRRMMGQ
uniref:hypothetical protein n=1 Tax=Rhodococcus qingshengii TaxID=334542 RepID=UPI001C4E0A1A|nr:hypothetical protein [Rhodococcus qingshengii]